MWKDEKCFKIENPKSYTPVLEKGFDASMDSPDQAPPPTYATPHEVLHLLT